MGAHTPNQDDRDAVASLIGAGKSCSWGFASDFKMGRADKNPLIQAFAAHRINSHKELVSALEAIRDLPGEVNLSNYDHDDVSALNSAHIEAYQIAVAALSKYQDGGEG